ncbi:MAG: hypothetical protein ABI899_09420 [Actinomycetota bacterium]
MSGQPLFGHVLGDVRALWPQFQMFTRIPNPPTAGAGTFVVTPRLKPLAAVHETVTVLGTCACRESVDKANDRALAGESDPDMNPTGMALPTFIRSDVYELSIHAT